QVTVAAEQVALVEGRLAVGTWRIRDVAERATAREQRGLPAVPPEPLEPPHPLAPDPQTAAGEGVFGACHPHCARRAEQLLVAGPAHQVALDRCLQRRA